MPHLTQYVCFELTEKCNLGHVHAACPNRSPLRFSSLNTLRKMDDDTIVHVAERLYNEFGFTGSVCWHYYCEPLLEADRMFRLMDRIKQTAPQASFVLWTNGTLFPEDGSRFAAFRQIHVTDYTGDGHRPKNLDGIRKACSDVQVHKWPLDKRLAAIGGRDSRKPCARMFVELIVDVHGNLHPCCIDWKGLGSVGNVFVTPLDELVFRWQSLRDGVAGKEMAPDAPAVCRKCQSPMRSMTVSRFVTDAADRAKLYLQSPKSAVVVEPARPQQNRLVSVVFVHYAMPEDRLTQHFEWNDDVYRASAARVFVVTDKQYTVPDYACCLVFPERELPLADGRRMFSLAKTKNYGIAEALRRGTDVCIVTDSDMRFPERAWKRMCAVGDAEAVVPVYQMRTWYDRNDKMDHYDYGCTGTIAMTVKRWKRHQFDANTWGYGAEDGLMLRSIANAGVKVIPANRRQLSAEIVVEHMPHVLGSNPRRRPGSGNNSCWNRDTINPDNCAFNQKVGK